MKYLICALFVVSPLFAQEPPYDVYPEVEEPYYRVRYEASEKSGELIFPVKYTVWIPSAVETLRGLIIHQHGCGEGSCKSGLTGAWDLHWQALAKKHDCALMAPAYEQPQDGNCQMWCDPRNGSGEAFQKSLIDLGKMSGHPELAEVPWALWGHSGGGHWAGGMTILHPGRVVAAWLRSGVPLFEENPDRDSIKAYSLSEAVLKVPIMCNPGTKEGVTVKDGRFAGVWPANEKFLDVVRGKGGLVGVAIDPLTAHECGNQRYMAIPWLDACLTARLPEETGASLRAMPTDEAWLAVRLGDKAVPEAEFEGDVKSSTWLPNAAVAKKWMQYVKNTEVTDTTPPPSPTNIAEKRGVLTWDAEADLESGIGHFIILRDNMEIATVPDKPKNPFGRPIFQGLQYSDTPVQPLVKMEYAAEEEGDYRVISVNTVGLKSE